MRTFEELVEEAERRTVLVVLVVLIAAYCMSLTSNSVLVNIPVAIILLALFRRLSFELEIRLRRPTPETPRVYQKKYVPFKDFLVSPGPSSWKRKIDSPAVEAAVDSLIRRLVAEWVTDLWYSSITPDQEAPLEIRSLVNGIIGEIAVRAKQVNLINLLTRDVVNAVATHLELYREAQASVGTDLFSTLSSEERDEKIKQYLVSVQKLHPGVRSPEQEVQVLQRLMGGVLSFVLKPEDAQCKVLVCIGRELLACAVMRPVLQFASPLFINQVLETIALSPKADSKAVAEVKPANAAPIDSVAGGDLATSTTYTKSYSLPAVELSVTGSEVATAGDEDMRRKSSAQKLEGGIGCLDYNAGHSGDWAQALDAFNQRKSQALAPEHLDNVWAKGRNYRKRESAKSAPSGRIPELEPLETKTSIEEMSELRDLKTMKNGPEEIVLLEKTRTPVCVDNNYYGREQSSRVVIVGEDSIGVHTGTGRSSVIHHPLEVPSLNDDSPRHQRSRSLEGLDKQDRSLEVEKRKTGPGLMIPGYKPKLSCRVIGAHYEKSGSKSFAVYSISVSDAEGKTWVVLRRYRNFEQLHRRLRDMPHYTLSLPPKRFLSSNLDNSFVRERCVLLNKYLKDLLSIPSIAELHEVWDFLSFKSQNYGFSEPVSIIKTLAVNVDDAVDDVFRQLKGVKKANTPSYMETGGGMSSIWNVPPSTSMLSEGTNASQPSDDEGEEDYQTGWHSDSEVHNRLAKTTSGCFSDGHSPVESLAGSETNDDEWTPPRLTVPLLNLVDVVFQLEARGWIRRQVLWIAKQVLQLGMGDAIDDWLLARIQYLRREDVVASGIKWIEKVLWPDGVFITKRADQSASNNGAGVGASQLSFEEQLEAARRAMVVRELIQERAPTPLVSLIGRRQYQRCAKDIYGFLQSTVCIKHLAFSLLDKLVAAAFPELEDLITTGAP